jgi:hypothetical protein
LTTPFAQAPANDAPKVLPTHCVTKAVLNADVVIFGVDRQEPVIDAERLCEERDFQTRPLTFIDFNSFASTRGMDDRPGLAPRIESG